MLEDRYYMRQAPFEPQRSATVMLLIANAVIFLIECLVYGYPPHFSRGDYFALSWTGLKHGYIWQLLTFQFLHGGLLHLLFNCWAIYVFGRELEQTLGKRQFLTLYFASGVLGGLAQAMAGGLAELFPQSPWMSHFGGAAVGASAGAFGLVAAFAMLYPERPLTLLLFFIIPLTIRAKFLLWFSGLLAIFGMLFPVGNIADAAHLGGMLTGVVFVRYAIHWNWQWPQFNRRRKQPPTRLVRVGSSTSALWTRNKNGAGEDLPPEEFLSKEVDPILDKISAHGIQSLTDRERRILQAARDKMAKR